MTDATGMTQGMRSIWVDLLGRGDIHADADFFVLGGDSLAATILMVHVEEMFAVTLDPTEIFETPTFGAFLSKVEALVQELVSSQVVEEGVL